MTSAAIDRLVEVSAEHHADLSARLPQSAIFSVRPPSPSGAPAPDYLIKVDATDAWIAAREVTPVRLPAFCPERHINPGGSFCLFWAEEEPLRIESTDSAGTWWSKLLVFLRRQESARALRRWPGKEDSRAHGEEAARYQAYAERLAAEMGPRFAARLREGRFRVNRKPPHGRERLRLTLDGRRFVSVIDSLPRVITLRQRCKCDGAITSKLPLRSCGNHAQALARFALSLERQEQAEKRFFAEIRAANLKCCGTIDDCPLAA